MVKRHSFNHTTKVIGFRQAAVLSGHGFTLKQYSPAAVFCRSSPAGSLNVKPLLLTAVGVLRVGS